MNSPIKHSIKLLTIGAASLGLLAGCSSDSDYDFEGSEVRQQEGAGASVGAFSPADGGPFPNDLLFLGSEDGTLNVPVADPEDYGDPAVALSTLDGFSTIEPIISSFGKTFSGDFGAAVPEQPLQLIDASTVSIQDSIRVFEVSRGAQTEVTGILGELDATQALATVIPTDAEGNGTQLAIFPLEPLKEHTTYMVLVTNGVSDVTDVPLSRSFTYGLLAGASDLPGDLGQVQGLIRAMLGAGAAAGVSVDSVMLSWTFTTQSTRPVLQGLKDAAIPSPILVVDTQLDTGALSPDSPDLADIYVGEMSVPYYLDVPSADNPTASLTTFFTNASGSFLTPIDNAPIVKNTLAIPVLMTVPNKIDIPEGGWPIAIFQHGITRNRADMLAIADSMAAVGFATIAIDIPLHGITPNDTALAGFRQEGKERHFDVDFDQDGSVDNSGTYFYNLGNLLNTRDNTRQAVADLFTLSASVGTIEGINPARKVFIGHSLGAIVGTTFLAFDDTINSATLAVGAGGLPRILANSPAFGPAIAAGLESAGIDINSADGNAFLNAAQAVVGSVDPINHAAAAGANTAVHMIQINGDTVVINNLPGFPLVGTEPLARIMGLDQVTADTAGSGFVKFSTGYHGSLLSPADSNPEDDRDAAAALAVFQEMQSQVRIFAVSGNIDIEDTSVIDGAVAP